MHDLFINKVKILMVCKWSCRSFSIVFISNDYHILSMQPNFSYIFVCVCVSFLFVWELSHLSQIVACMIMSFTHNLHVI
jgi:hypothetical protein